MSYRPDAEAQRLAHERAVAQQSQVFAGYRPGLEARLADPTAMLDLADPLADSPLPAVVWDVALWEPPQLGGGLTGVGLGALNQIHPQLAQMIVDEFAARFAAAATVIGDAFAELARQIVAAVDPIVGALVKAFVEFQSPAGDSGPAGFVCPRHGVQDVRWGCRRCQRQGGRRQW